MEGAAMIQSMHIVNAVLLASFGALARLLNHKDTKAMGIAGMISGCFVAAFTGAMVHFLSEYCKWDVNLGYIIAGISGWIGPQVLDALSAIMMKKAGIDMPAGNKSGNGR